MQQTNWCVSWNAIRTPLPATNHLLAAIPALVVFLKSVRVGQPKSYYGKRSPLRHTIRRNELRSVTINTSLHRRTSTIREVMFIDFLFSGFLLALSLIFEDSHIFPNIFLPHQAALYNVPSGHPTTRWDVAALATPEAIQKTRWLWRHQIFKQLPTLASLAMAYFSLPSAQDSKIKIPSSLSSFGSLSIGPKKRSFF